MSLTKEQVIEIVQRNAAVKLPGRHKYPQWTYVYPDIPRKVLNVIVKKASKKIDPEQIAIVQDYSFKKTIGGSELDKLVAYSTEDLFFLRYDTGTVIPYGNVLSVIRGEENRDSDTEGRSLWDTPAGC